MELEFTLYMRLNWTDNRLNFTDNRTSYDSLTLGDDIVDRLWIPDLFFHHERKAELHGFFTKNQLAYIYKNGSVLYSGRFSVKSHCAMDLTYYPYDTQTCSIVIQSYAFTKDELLLYWNGDNAVNVKVNTVNLKFGKTVLLHSFDSPYDHPVGNYSTLTANITFNRTADSFEIMYIAPPVVLVIISLTSFLLADSISSRIIVSTGASTQLIMQWAGIYNKLPPVSDLTYIDGWMLGNLVFIGYNIIINAAIYHFVILKEKEEKEEMKEQKTKKENIKMESKIDKRNDNVLEDNHLEMQASGHTTQRNQSTSRQQSEGQIVKNIDETSPLVINEQSTYDTIEKEGIKENNTSVDDMDGRSRHNLGYNHGEGQEHEMTSSSDNQGNESQNSTNQVIDKIRNIWKRLKDLIFFLHDYFKKKKDFREFLEDYEEITTSTKWEDAKEILKEDPRFERARKSNMASTWYKTYIDKLVTQMYSKLVQRAQRQFSPGKQQRYTVLSNKLAVSSKKSNYGIIIFRFEFTSEIRSSDSKKI
ncbi:glutamate-gated chloride channel-like [Mercenaria mercenaria]|uniref:glutamate-gated chloride channel-like n=1 Tax=Mercenaria mercenaria TaxID=6596 RepID=UPI00234E3FAB|nr:glutamate-gated chloride channel-like [Mercenaria mercenaria]